MTTTTPQEIVEAVLARSRSTAAVVAVQEESGVNYRWAVSTPTTNGDTRARHVTITALASDGTGWKAGTRSGPVADWPALLAGAEADAESGQPGGEGSELPEPVVRADFDSVPAAPAAAGLPTGLDQAFGTEGREVFGFAEQSVTTSYIGTSNGSRWRAVERSGRFEISAKHVGRTRSAWYGAAGEEVAEIDAAAGLSIIDQGLTAQARRVDLPAQPTKVILTPSAVADLMIVLWWSAVARDAAEGHSPFSGTGPSGTAIGRVLSDRDVTLTSDAHWPDLGCPDLLWTPGSSAAATVFDTGMALRPVDWIDGGRLSALAATRAAAREFGLPAVASPDNLIMTDAAGEGSLADVVARTERALLITSLWYIREVDLQSLLVTGLTRDGTYLVEDGEIVGATGNFRFNDSPIDLLSRIVDAGESVRCLPREWADYFTRTIMPPLVVDAFGLSTESAAV
ncbi:MAG: TldD/PmbA family protein [Actinobacteria bacterium]|nr:TldD/PmbA family protein [Actinomycetota bacterium]